MLKRKKPSDPNRLRPICLALQGGGSHGAFQWGVLDRLLEDGRLEIKAVTAASAGAMNGAALISGMAANGRDGAREALDKLWREMNQSGGRNVFGDSGVWNAMTNPGWLKETPFWRSFKAMAMSSSPYEFNPFNLNPLKRVIDASIDFEAVRRSPIKLFVSATAVKHGRARIFTSAEISDAVLLATACLPHLFQAVTIEDEPYWDGGYLANPALWPLFYDDTPDDILLLPLNPFEREDTPKAPGEIVDRMNEIAFNAPLTAELRAVAFVQELIEEGQLTETARGRYRHILLHAVSADGHLDDLSLGSKFNTEWTFLQSLKARGREAADHWLEHCLPAVGERSSMDMKRFL